ncbi:MAG: type IV secretory system conjugative DNA transfer family protein [Candidatus Acidiferrum sp.]
MAQIIIGKSGGKNVHIDLDVLLTTRLLLTADSGGGKTYALKKLCEEIFGKVPIHIIDPEGEFAALRERFGFVFVGKGGETPADVRSAGMVAQKLLEYRASAICDIYEMKPSQRHEWVRNYIDGLIEAPKKLRHPTIILVDEAHMFCPEHGKGESIASEAMISLCTRGRKRGLCAIWATQRLAVLNKDASGMLLNRLIGPTFEDVNLKRAMDILSVSREHQNEFRQQTQLMEPGNFWALGRAISKERILVKIGKIATPHGEEAMKYSDTPPPAPASIAKLLPKLSDLPKAAEEKAKTEAELRSEIRSLKAQLRVQPTVSKEVKVADPKAIEQALNKQRAEYEKTLRLSESAAREGLRVLVQIRDMATKTTTIYGEPIKLPKVSYDKSTVQRSLPSDPAHRTETRPPAPQYAETPRLAQVETNGNKLRSGAERMLAALATWHPNGMSEGQMRAHAGLKKSGTFSAYMSDLRKGYIEERNGMVFATQQGLDYCQHIPAAPQTTEEVLNIWNPKLRDGARRMLDALVRRGGEAVSKEELGELAQLQKSGTFSAYLSDLKTARLAIVNRDGTVAANKETLFL